ncbi:MAG: recombinase family protein [Candidatus Riflebacteria bacterium]|nr:recombinase family protein [Candidatus Riflebacteria bacterium]
MRFVFKQYSEGQGLKAIVTEIEKRGWRPRRAKEWSHHNLFYLLRYEAYKGVLVWRKSPDPSTWIRNEGALSRIIDEEAWNKVQARVKIRSTEYTNAKVLASTHPFSGHLFCGACGSRYVTTAKLNGNWRLCCSKRKHEGCKASPYFDEPPLLVKVKSAILENILTPARIKDALSILAKGNYQENERLKKETTNIKKQIVEIERRENLLFEALETGNLPAEETSKRLQLLADNKRSLVQSLQDVQEKAEKVSKRSVVSPADIKSTIALLRESLETKGE